MPPFEAFGRLLLVLGLIIAALGLLILLLGRFPMLGRLPGDILIQRDNTTIWFPIVTSLVLSVVLSLLIMIVARFFER